MKEVQIHAYVNKKKMWVVVCLPHFLACTEVPRVHVLGVEESPTNFLTMQILPQRILEGKVRAMQFGICEAPLVN